MNLKLKQPGFYKENIVSIESLLSESFSNNEFMRSKLFSMFGFSKKDIDEGIISEEEYKKFVLLCKFLGKRIINASAQKYGEQVTLSVKVADLDDKIFRLFFHDIAHSISCYEINSKRQERNYQTEFYFLSPKQEINNLIAIEEEAFALLFEGLNGLPLSIKILQDFQQEYFDTVNTKQNPLPVPSSKIENFENYIKAYLSFVYGVAIRSQNDLRIDEEVKDTKVITRLKDKYLKVATALLEKPNSKLVEYLKYIYENRNSKRVLFDLFMRLAHPLLEKIEKRYLTRN